MIEREEKRQVLGEKRKKGREIEKKKGKEWKE